MSGHGQGQAPGYRERPSDRQPTQHHGDSYHRSLRHDEYGHDLSQVRDTRTSGIPGITPRHNRTYDLGILDFRETDKTNTW